MATLTTVYIRGVPPHTHCDFTDHATNKCLVLLAKREWLYPPNAAIDETIQVVHINHLDSVKKHLKSLDMNFPCASCGIFGHCSQHCLSFLSFQSILVDIPCTISIVVGP
jgi:hypothetical protein